MSLVATVRRRHAARSPLLLALTTALCAGGLLVSMTPTPAQAWGTGGDNRSGRIGYGTHDWVIDQADQIAGPAGSWLDAKVARDHSGDPDVYFPRPTEHVFMQKGRGRGAAQQVVNWYVATVQAYNAGDTRLASERFGIMAHYYADITQPYHTAYNGTFDKARHTEYEQFTTMLTNGPTAARNLCVRRPLAPATDIRRMAISAAAYSRQFYPSLSATLGRYAKNDMNMVRNGEVRAITSQVLSRACNDLASILASVPTGSALPRAVARVTVTMVRAPLRVGLSPMIDIRVTDAAGKPLEGVELKVDFPGTAYDQRLYTMANGTMRTHGATERRLVKGKSLTVTVVNPTGGARTNSSVMVSAARGTSFRASSITSRTTYNVVSKKRYLAAKKRAGR